MRTTSRRTLPNAGGTGRGRAIRFFQATLPVWVAAWLAACTILALDARPAAGQESVKLRVAVKTAPPFVMKSGSGEWEGLAIEMWRRIAAHAGLSYEIVETDLKGLIDGVADGRFDVGIGALTITSERESRLDFSHSFHTTGLAIAARTSTAGFWSIMGNLASVRFLHAIGILFLILLGVGTLFWLFERRRNAQQFDRRPVRGIGSGLWLAAVTMTTVGYGDKAPISPAARVIAFVWMFTALILISTFTGMIASALTVDGLEGNVRSVRDLPKVAVGSVRGTSSENWLNRQRVHFRPFPSVEAGLDALDKHHIDAFVYDAPLLKYLIKMKYHGTRIGVLPHLLDRQVYAIALKPGSPHRERINVVLLQLNSSQEWSDLMFRYLGE